MKQLNWAYFVPPQTGIVAYAQSAPGQAKTASLRCLAAATQRRFLPCYLDQQLPEDIGGVPAPRTIEINGRSVDCVVKLLDETFLRAKLEPSIVLMDELNQASHSMMAAAQEWLNTPPTGTWVFAAGNPIAQSSNGVEFTPPLVNRLCVVEWDRPVDAIRQGWRNGFKDYRAPSIPVVPDDYLTEFGPFYGDILCEFIDQYPDLSGDEAYPKDAAKASEPWPSDRSWTNVGKLLCAADAVGALATVKHTMVKGCVGQPAALQLQNFLISKKLPDPRDLLAHPQDLKLPRRFDQARAIMSSVLGVLRSEKDSQLWENGQDLLEVAFDQQPETAMSAMGAAWKLKPEWYTPRIRKSDAAREMRKLLTDAA